MKTTIQSLHFTANDQLEEYVQKKMDKLLRLNGRILTSNVCLRLDKSGDTRNKVCEINLSLPGRDLFSKKRSQTFEKAANEAVNALQQQLLKRKTQLQKKKTA